MNLSKQVALLNLLDTIDISADRTEAIRTLTNTLQAITQYPTQIDDFSQRLESDFVTIRSSIDQFTNSVNELKRHVQKQIIGNEIDNLQNSIRIYQTEMIHERPEYIFQRKLEIDDESQSWLQSRLRALSDWRYPALCIRPLLEEHVKIMVALDPLYIMDQDLALLEPAVNQFEPQYQRRLRQYIVNDYHSAPLLEALPKTQFAVVLAYNFFNYKPLHVIERYLNDIYHILRPGGRLIFSYNNCDYAHGVSLAERNFMTYTPLRLLKPLIVKIGYDIVSNRHCDGDADIIELCRPGTLSSLRGGQTFARIVANT